MTPRPFLSIRLAALLAAFLIALVPGCMSNGLAGGDSGGDPGGGASAETGISGDRGGGTEIPNEVRGVLRTLAGAPAVGAEVTLLPAAYVPDSATVSAAKLVALTDSAGRYAFRGVPDGDYNAFFRAAGAAGDMAFHDSIRVAGGAADVPGDTLRAPGLLSTIVKLAPQDLHRLVVVQVLGTDVFRKATASEAIDIRLPQGTFNVRVSVDIPEVQPVSETVPVASGASDTLTVTFPTYLFPVIW